MTGLFITFEGVEGCGKSTQIGLLESWLAEDGHHVSVTREPGGAPIAETIRDILLDPANSALCATAELLLYEAARAQHVVERIRPALERGEVVLCDRFADSTTAYQGGGRELDRETLTNLHHLAADGVWPDLTIVIDVPADVGLARAAARTPADRLEQESLDFHERVRAEYLELAELEPERVKVVDGTQSVQNVARAIQKIVAPRLETR